MRQEEECEMNFDAWIADRTGYDLDTLQDRAAGSDPGSRIYRDMLKSFRRIFDDQNAGQNLNFVDWLLRRTGKNSAELREIAMATGSFRDYSRMMDWYWKRYEMETVNPFFRDVVGADAPGNGE